MLGSASQPQPMLVPVPVPWIGGLVDRYNIKERSYSDGRVSQWFFF